MTAPHHPRPSLDEGIAALEKDLLAEGGPRISTMRNYRFAILCYHPEEEFALRQRIRRLTDRLKGEDWNVLPISLQQLLLDRLRALGQDTLQSLIAREQSLHTRSPDRALAYLRERISPHIEGPEGIAADVARQIDDFIRGHPERLDRTLVLIGRAGALYPFFRSSALLKHIDGRTHNLPVVLLYPGERKEQTGLSFMGQLPADRDYRPRIYP